MSTIGDSSPTSTANTSTSPPASIPPPGVGEVQFGTLRRLQPISSVFGVDRGQCIDRYYIERFLANHTRDIRGRVLEIADNNYTHRFGRDRVTHSDVLHLVEGNHKATLIADLTHSEQFPQDAFDCIILTQTLQHIYDIRAAVRTLHRILKPGGVVLATLPGISQISRYDMDRWGDFWRFTTLSARRLFAEAFPPQNIKIEAFGNVLAAASFLYGVAAEELREEDLNYADRDYELVITVRAWKQEAPLQ